MLQRTGFRSRRDVFQLMVLWLASFLGSETRVRLSILGKDVLDRAALTVGRKQNAGTGRCHFPVIYFLQAGPAL